MLIRKISLPVIFNFKRSIYQCAPLFSNYSDALDPVPMAFNVFESKPETDKNAPPLIIMHGLFGSKQNWRGIGRALETKLKRRIFTVDARNHGDSPHSHEHSSAHMAADVAEFLRVRDIPKASVMGHSMGGRAMMFFAMKYPHLVDHGIVVDISPITLPRDFTHMEQIFDAMRKTSVPTNVSLAQGRVLAEKEMLNKIKSEGAKQTVEFLMQNLRKQPTGEFYWACNVESLYNNLRIFSEFMQFAKHFPQFKGPMMFLCGSQSRFVDPESWPEIQGLFPNAIIHWLDAGHLVHFDQPVEFIELVVNFLQK